MLGTAPTGAEPACERDRVAQGRAFTLVELLITVSIIVLLLSILMPSLKRAVRMAKNTVCMYNLRQISHGIQMYQMDNGGWIPVAEKRSRDDIVTPRSLWFYNLFPTYLNDPMVLFCPDDPVGVTMDQGMGIDDYPLRAATASYGINGFIMSSPDTYLANLDRNRPARASDTLLLADIGPDNRTADDRLKVRVLARAGTQSVLGVAATFVAGKPRPQESWLTLRHSGRINSLTAGGSVRPIRTDVVVRRRVETFYPRDAAGGCTLCNEFEQPHYSFQDNRVYWWTGLLPKRQRLDSP